MPVIPKDPLDWLTLFRQQVDVIFNYLSGMQRSRSKQEHEYVPLVDIFETADSYVIEFELPGFNIRDIRLSICCSTLIFEGVKRREHLKRRSRFVRVERHFGHFSRMIEIPPMADIGAVRARYAHGTLSVTFPYQADRQVVIKEISIECDEHA